MRIEVSWNAFVYLCLLLVSIIGGVTGGMQFHISLYLYLIFQSRFEYIFNVDKRHYLYKCSNNNNKHLINWWTGKHPKFWHKKWLTYYQTKICFWTLWVRLRGRGKFWGTPLSLGSSYWKRSLQIPSGW